jgi:hypothetical protein
VELDIDQPGWFERAKAALAEQLKAPVIAAIAAKRERREIPPRRWTSGWKCGVCLTTTGSPTTTTTPT